MSTYPGRTASASGSSEGFEIMLALVALVLLGPFALTAGALVGVATPAERRRLLFPLAALGFAAGYLLWPSAHGHYQHALVVTKELSLVAEPGRILHAAFSALWHVWLETLTLVPAIGLLIAYRRSDELAAGPEQQARARRRAAAKREAKIAWRARKTSQAEQEERKPGEGFLGFYLSGDRLLPMQRQRVFVPFHQPGLHITNTGATGSGKTETNLRLAYSAARSSDWAIVYIDGKGDRETMRRFEALMLHAGREVSLFPGEAYAGWHGSPEEITNRLLCLIDFATEGGGTYYRDLAVNAIRIACQAPGGPPGSSQELLRRLQESSLKELYRGDPGAHELKLLRPEDLQAVRARYAAFFGSLKGQLDGTLNLEQIDTAYFLLDGLRLKYEAGYLARFLVEDFTQWAVARKPRARNVLLVVDEFSAIAEAGRALVDVVERTRGFGVTAVLSPQVAEGMGGTDATSRILGSTKLTLVHAMPHPELFIDAGGTEEVYSVGQQTQEGSFTGLGTARVQHVYSVSPNEVRRLTVGQCFAISAGQAMKLQVVPAPTLARLEQERAEAGQIPF